MTRAVREAIRSLGRSPVFTLTSVASLAISIGLACAVFTVAHAIFFAPLPFQDAERLVELWQTAEPGSEQTQDYLQPAQVTEWVDSDWRTLEGVSASGLGAPLLQYGPEGAQRVDAVPIVGDWFGTMGVPARTGRVLTPDDLAPGAGPAAVVSARFARERLDDGIGALVDLSGTLFTVVGIMPESFSPLARIWVAAEALPDGRRPLAYAGFGRLRDGASHDEAKAEVHQRSATDLLDDPDRFGGMGVTAKALGAQARRPEKPALWMLAGVVTAVLLIGLSNLTQFFLIRAQARSTGLAVRAAMGGSKWQIGQGLVAEAALIGLLGGGLGLVLARPGTTFVVSWLSSRYHFENDPQVGGLAFALAGGLALLATLMVGLEPARRVATLDLQALLQRRSGGAVSSRHERRTRNVMVATQVATSLVLVTAAVVQLSAYDTVRHADMGYDADRLVQAVPDYEIAGLDPTTAQWPLALTIADRLSTMPTVAGVAVWQTIGQGYPPRPEYDAVADGPSVEPGRFDRIYGYERIRPGTLAALGIPLIAGRRFTEADGPGSAPVVMITRRTAEVFWPNESALGGQLKFGEAGVWHTVVGIVEDHHRLDELGRFVALGTRRDSRAFVPIAQQREAPEGWGEVPCCSGVRLAVRPDDGLRPHVLAPALLAEFAALAPDLPVVRAETMRDLQMGGYLGNTIASSARLVGLGAAVAVLLALVGITGVVSEGLSRRVRELGLRIALGALPGHVTRVVAVEALLTTGAGLVAGLAAAAVIHVTASAFLFDYYVLQVTNGLLDPGLLALGVAAVLASTTGAVFLTARRATAVDPAVALRSE